MSTGMMVGAQEEASYRIESDHRLMEKKPKKGNFFKRWMLKIVKEEAAKEQERNKVENMKVPRGINLNSTPSIDQPDRAIQFTVYPATGGRVIETRRYERKTDRHSNGLYIITNDQDFGREIDKIITMESLK